jgi:hypothetical protein
MIYDNYAHASIEIISWKSFPIFQILSVMVGKSLVAKNHIYLGKIVGFVGFNFIVMTFQLITQWFFLWLFFDILWKIFSKQNSITNSLIFSKICHKCLHYEKVINISYFTFWKNLQTWLNIFITPCHFRNITKLKKKTLLPTLEIVCTMNIII